MFHFYISTCWLSTYSIDETYGFNVSLLVSMFHFKKTLWERFKNTVGEIQKHWGRDLKTLWERFKNTEGAMKRSLSVLKNGTWNLKWNMKLKMKHWNRMFHFLNTLIINQLKHKNETWKINQRFWKRIEMCPNRSLLILSTYQQTRLCSSLHSLI